MGIFDKFNNQGLDDAAAFENLCCQLFETWGLRAKQFDASWEFLNIRGDGGDGGIEAFWHNIDEDTYIGLQAKWFKNTITKGQYKQIKKSIDEAIEVRPSLKQYIVCLPHNLTSLRKSKGKTISSGEEASWKDFSSEIEQTHPGVELLLWDEHRISMFLQEAANEGCRRCWFEKSAINLDSIKLALNKTLASLRDRYVPEIADGGKLAAFLDNFFGTIENRLLVIKDIDSCLATCRDLLFVVDSFTCADNEIPDGLKEAASRCADAMRSYEELLSSWRRILVTEPQKLLEIESVAVDYGAIEDFESGIQTLRDEHKLTGHVDEILRLINKFRELPGDYEIRRTLCDAFSHPHCLIIGEQGTGKTCGFASEAAGFLDGGTHLPILIRAGEINGQDGWREAISYSLGLDGWTEAELWQALSSLAAMRDLRERHITVRAKVAILVDGLDERHPTKRWTELIRQGDAISREYPRIKFAYSSRPHGVECTNTADLWGCVHRIDDDGDVPVRDLFDRYIEHYRIDLAGNTRYKWMLRTPMELNMFCTAYSGRRIDKEVSACLTYLINAEVDRLDEEYAARSVRALGVHDTPVRSALAALARAFLEDDTPRNRVTIGGVVESADIQPGEVANMLDFLESYGILATIQRPGTTSVSPAVVMYQPGSRHLWDYFMAVVLMETGDDNAAKALFCHGDAALMYSTLLIERRGILPVDNELLAQALGDNRVRELTIDALATAEKSASGKFRQWTLEEMGKDRDSLYDMVNGIVIQVAGERDHPLGPSVFDEYMRSFRTPIERDRVWSIPKKIWNDHYLSVHYERDAVKHLPYLNEEDEWNQMPLLLVWCLTSVSNLRRRHCRNELVRWAMGNPGEFVKLFDRFSNCDDPQVREDMFAIAEEVVCQGKTGPATMRRMGNVALNSIFSSPDIPGNRNAALRYYGRMIVERCIADGVVNASASEQCRPPYMSDAGADALPIYSAASSAERMVGYDTIEYDLARYVLVDKLESAFGMSRVHPDGTWRNDDIMSLVKSSADMAGVVIPSFDGWVISAAYQYLVDHGYDPDTFSGQMDEGGNRLDGIDRRIAGSFGSADHGSRSTVMTVAEKYVWCARNEICGFMADRIPVHETIWQDGVSHETYGLAHDYGSLFSFQSPLFEATVNRLEVDRANVVPSFPTPFACDGNEICSERELNDWINAGSAESIVSLLNHVPNVSLSLDGNVIPVALYVSDWGACGKQAQGWAYCGLACSAEVEKLSENGTVAIDGYDNASAFTTGINVEAAYTSPVEYMASPWIGEYNESPYRTKVADVHITASPLSGSGVDNLTGIGDRWYRFPSIRAMELTGVRRTDGARYFNADDKVIFEDVDYGESYKKHYQALLVDKDKLFDDLRGKDLHPVWYATLQRGGNRLAEERLTKIDARSEISWLIWIDADNKYRSCRMSDDYLVPERDFDSSELIKELIEKYATETEDNDGFAES